ncbi:hypothetical protein [Hymenobacter persicinus]|nr:hypothetical protein [Hymenobacter persicinus]
MKQLCFFLLAAILSACTTTSSSRTLSPDREQANPRNHAVSVDSAATTPG